MASKRYRFVRLSPNYAGLIYFYDKKQKKIFHIHSRNKIDSLTADQIFTQHDYSLTFLIRYLELVERYKNLSSSKKRNLIIDCGANIGLSTRYFAEEYPSALIIAIEPDLENIKMARKNCSHLKNVIFQNYAVGSTKGFVRIKNPNDDPNSYKTTRQDVETDIEVVTIKDILSEYSDCQLFLTKIDIEGFEKDLFAEETDWVKDSAIIILELHDWLFPKMGTSINFLRVISEQNRDFIYKGENIFSISNFD